MLPHRQRVNIKDNTLQRRSVNKSWPSQPERNLVFQTKLSAETDFSIMQTSLPSSSSPPHNFIYFLFKNSYGILRACTVYYMLCHYRNPKKCKQKPDVQKTIHTQNVYLCSFKMLCKWFTGNILENYSCEYKALNSKFFGHTINKARIAIVCQDFILKLYTLSDEIYFLGYLFSMCLKRKLLKRQTCF